MKNERIGYYVCQHWNYEPDYHNNIDPYTVSVGIAFAEDEENNGVNFEGSHDGYSFDIYDSLKTAANQAKEYIESVDETLYSDKTLYLDESLSDDECKVIKEILGTE